MPTRTEGPAFAEDPAFADEAAGSEDEPAGWDWEGKAVGLFE
jgi:hypothetical protein